MDTFKEARKLFPRDKERRLFYRLLEGWRRKRKPILVKFYIPRKKEFPLAVAIGVLGEDWPGLSDAVTGAVHERGWNIYYEAGYQVQRGKKNLGIMIVSIRIENERDLIKFRSQMEGLSLMLEKISIGSFAKKLLLATEVKRIEIYTRTIEKIKELVKDRKTLSALICPGGEATKFFASRSRAYIEERKVEDIAKIIIKNHELMKRVRETGGSIQVWVENLKTLKEDLTGITVAAYERDLSLRDVLDALSRVVPGFRMKFNKEFTTSDGIVVIRLEISDPRGKSYPSDIHPEIEEYIKRIQIMRRTERMRWIESIGGFEHYMRAIIPFLVKEFTRTGIPQVFISLVASTEFFLDYKIIVVADKNKELEGVLKGITRTSGIKVLSVRPPKIFGNAAVHLFDTRVDLDYFRDVGEVYSKLLEILEKGIGRFRDFDRGMREMDVDKLMKLRERFRDMDEFLLRELYYSIEDFYRVSAPEDELATLIELGRECLSRFKGKTVLKVKHTSLSSLVAIATPWDPALLSRVLDLGREYEMTLSRYERENLVLLLLRISKNGKPVKGIEKEIKKLLSS